ncbi:MAG: hypothetical protein ACREKS_15770 [Candidatus Rokuibacteriota bacterium]
MRSPENALATLQAALDAVWAAPPEDLEGLRRQHRPPSTDMPKRLYANFDLYWLAGVFYVLRESLESGALGAEPASMLVQRFVELAASRLQRWGFADATTVLAGVAVSGEIVSHPAALSRLLADLIVYLNRLQSWVDATIPWAALDAVPPLAVPRPSDGGP